MFFCWGLRILYTTYKSDFNVSLFRHKLFFFFLGINFYSTYGTKCRAFAHKRNSILGLQLTVLWKGETYKQIKPNVLCEVLKERHDGTEVKDTKPGEVNKSCGSS